jgi:hypothetical protein
VMVKSSKQFVFFKKSGLMFIMSSILAVILDFIFLADNG